MDDREGGLVIARDFQRMRYEKEVRALRQDRPAQAQLRLLEMVLQLSVRNLQTLVTGRAESADRIVRLFLAPGPVIVAVCNLLDAAAAIGQEEDSDHRAGGGELGGEPAAAQ